MIRWALIATIGFAVLFAGPARTANGEEPSDTAKTVVTNEQTIRDLRAKVNELVVRNQRMGRRIRRQYLTISRQRNQLRRAARSYGSISSIIALGATAFGQSPGILLRKAGCESHFWPYARNRSSGASGLFQFLPSTWRSTPFGGFSIWDPFAQSLAAGWMHRMGRGNEWSCR